MAVRLGFIGMGLIARMHWEHLAKRDDVSIVAFCDIDESRLHPPALEYGAMAFTDYREMLEKAELDAVYICVPPYVDGPLEIDCLEAGRHIFVEKPVALDLETTAKVQAAIDKSGLICSVGYHWRYMGATDLAREMMAGEETGLLVGHWVGGVPGAFWWPQLKLSGGQMTEQCTHILDLARTFGGEVVQVSATGSKGINARIVKDHDIWDTQTACLTFNSGVNATIYTSNIAHHCPGCGLKIYTPESSFEITEVPWSSQLTVRRKGQRMVYTGQDRGWIEPRHVEDNVFIEAVKSGDASNIRCDYADAVRTLAVNIAINKATVTGRTIDMSAAQGTG